jgi:hypothetical protein
VLLTVPLETFSVGNTIVISRGLIDVLPDEASLAAVLAHELAHIVLGHNLGSKYAFNDRMLFSDDSTYNNLGFKHIPEEEATADKKAIELLNNSPYAQKLDNVGLFLKAIQARAPQLNALLTAHLGNPLAETEPLLACPRYPPRVRRSITTSWIKSRLCLWGDASRSILGMTKQKW